MRKAHAGPNIDEGGLDGESGDMVCTRTGRNISPSVVCASHELGEAGPGTVVLVEAINK